MQSGSSKFTVAESSCSWWYPAAEKNPTDNAKNQSFKIDFRNIPPPSLPLKDNLFTKVKVNFGWKKQKIKCREFSACFGVGFPISSPFFLLSISLHLLKLGYRCLGTPDFMAPQPYICYEIQNPLSERLGCDGMSPVSLLHLEGQVHPFS